MYNEKGDRATPTFCCHRSVETVNEGASQFFLTHLEDLLHETEFLPDVRGRPPVLQRLLAVVVLVEECGP